MRAVEGLRFGSLVILHRERDAQHVRVRCDCGIVKTTWLRPLVRGVVVSCGCSKLRKTIERSTTHGGCGTPEYRAWRAMRQRCLDPRAHNFKYYGGLGVGIAARWDDFSVFLSDMGRKPSANHSIDRINPYGNYEPTNCRWATRAVQRNNTRRNYGSP